jgi:D-serine dehydratase
MPGGVPPFRLGDIGAHGWSLPRGDLPLPVLTLRSSALHHNIALLQRYCDRRAALLAPHGKTTMAPQIFRWQLEAGAWGLTVATAQQLQVYRRFGVDRVIFANQLVGPANVRYTLGQLRDHEDFECLVFVDSAAGVDLLARGGRDLGVPRPVQALVEVGYPGGRGGVRGRRQLEEVCRAVEQAAGRVRLVGVAGFEGLLALPEGRGAPGVRARITAYLESMARAVDRLRSWGVLDREFVVTAGGSGAFDLVVEVLGGRWPDSRLILRSGCYVSHDHGLYARTSPLGATSPRTGGEEPDGALRPALELWCGVQSRPEPDLALLTFGRRDAPHDSGFPVPLGRVRPGGWGREPLEGCVVTAMNDQHAYLRVSPDAAVAVGDILVCGVSHPCTAFDKWRLIPVVDDEGTVVGAVRTFF